jgi:hypothetical protein
MKAPEVRVALARALAAVVMVAATVVFVPELAGAQVTGGCSATIDGQDAGSAQNVRAAIVVNDTETIVVHGTAPGPISSYKVYLTFAGVRFPAAEGTVSNNDSSYTATVNVADYAKYGVGVYRVEGETTGTVCTGWAYVKVTGRFPLTTVAGIAGSLLALLGLLGLIASRPPAPPLTPTGPMGPAGQAGQPGALTSVGPMSPTGSTNQGVQP